MFSRGAAKIAIFASCALAGVVMVWKTGLSATPPVDLVLTIENPDPNENDWFGSSVAASASQIVVGTPQDDTVAFNGGAAYVFDSGSGSLIHSFFSPNIEHGGDNFGRSVAMIDSDFLVGATGSGTLPGAVYRYDGSSGDRVRTYSAPADPTSGEFGWAVTAVGDKVVVGAPRYDDPFVEAGRVYTFDGSTGARLLAIDNPTSAEVLNFGWSVAPLGDDRIIVGAPDASGSAGGAFVFDLNDGRLLTSIQQPDTSTETAFGWAVAAFGDDVLVSAKEDDTDAENAGKVFLFDGDSGQLIRTFDNPMPESLSHGDEFGVSVAARNNKVFVGAYLQATGTPSQGEAYVFDGNSGKLLQTLRPSASAQQLGFSLAPFDGRVAVGARFDNTGANLAGAVHVYQVVPEPSTLILFVIAATPIALRLFRPLPFGTGKPRAAFMRDSKRLQ